MDDIIYLTRFKKEIEAGGGCRRLLQIDEILAEYKIKVITINTIEAINKKTKFKKKIIKLVKKNKLINNLVRYYMTMGMEYFLWSENYRENVYNYRKLAKKWKNKIFKKYKPKLILIDDPIYFYPLIKKIKNNKVKLISICHNIESLSYGQVVKKKQRKLFNKEVKTLSLCDAVITISTEETFLMENLGIKTIFIPYYPVQEIKNSLLTVRKKRKQSEKKGLLLLGNINNRPTRHGINRFINYWQHNKISNKYGKLIVAGFGTNSLIKIIDTEKIKVNGEINNNELLNLLIKVEACICYQEKGAGALTKIMEMLIAGIPVLASFHAARSYYNLEGITVFKTLKDVSEALKMIKKNDNNIPIPTPPDTSKLKEFINN